MVNPMHNGISVFFLSTRYKCLFTNIFMVVEFFSTEISSRAWRKYHQWALMGWSLWVSWPKKSIQSRTWSPSSEHRRLREAFAFRLTTTKKKLYDATCAIPLPYRCGGLRRYAPIIEIRPSKSAIAQSFPPHARILRCFFISFKSNSLR